MMLEYFYFYLQVIKCLLGTQFIGTVAIFLVLGKHKDWENIIEHN